MGETKYFVLTESNRVMQRENGEKKSFCTEDFLIPIINKWEVVKENNTKKILAKYAFYTFLS